MSTSGVSVSTECVQSFNDLKLGKKLKYIIYKLSDDLKEIVVEEKSTESDWDVFREKLINAKSMSKGKEVLSPRYAVYDFEWELESGDGKRNCIAFISWSPDEGTPIMLKMVYSSSKDAIKRSLNGIGAEIQANTGDDIEFESMLKAVSKGKR